MKIDMDKTEERELEFASLHVKGQGVGAMLNMQTSFELSDAGGGTLMKWAADVKLAGPVGSMGQRVLQPIVNQQVQHVLKALDTQVQAAVANGGAPEDKG
jgi:carbon monoxide dehydrogenase subunit G